MTNACEKYPDADILSGMPLEMDRYIETVPRKSSTQPLKQFGKKVKRYDRLGKIDHC